MPRMANGVVHIVAAVIEEDDKYLITQRRDEAVLPLLWEFPGGRPLAGETDEDALRREVSERVGVDVVVHHKLTERTHPYDGYSVHLSLYSCHLSPGAVPRICHVRDVRWVSSSEFGNYQFPPADQATMDQLLGVRR
mgnify:CR=1 FL=1